MCNWRLKIGLTVNSNCEAHLRFCLQAARFSNEAIVSQGSHEQQDNKNVPSFYVTFSHFLTLNFSLFCCLLDGLIPFSQKVVCFE